VKRTQPFAPLPPAISHGFFTNIERRQETRRLAHRISPYLDPWEEQALADIDRLIATVKAQRNEITVLNDRLHDAYPRPQLFVATELSADFDDELEIVEPLSRNARRHARRAIRRLRESINTLLRS
jgi:hypothetical protein